jgi:hypothetical protein
VLPCEVVEFLRIVDLIQIFMSRVLIASRIEAPNIIAHVHRSERELFSIKVVCIDEIVCTLPGAVHKRNYRFASCDNLFGCRGDAVNELNVAI